MIDFEKFEDPDGFDPDDVTPEEADFLQEHYPELYELTGYARIDALIESLKEHVDSMNIIGGRRSVNDIAVDKMADTMVKVEDLVEEGSGTIHSCKVEWDKPYEGAAQIIYLIEYLDVDTKQLLEAVRDSDGISFNSINDEVFMMTLIFQNAYNYELYHLNNP